jgi:hypothetical protein
MFTRFGPGAAESWPDGAREAYAQRCFALLAEHAPNVPDAILHYEVLAHGARRCGPTADLRQVPARRDAEVVVRCVLDGLGTTEVRTRETIETVSGALVVSAGATVIATGPDAAPRPLTQMSAKRCCDERAPPTGGRGRPRRRPRSQRARARVACAGRR